MQDHLKVGHVIGGAQKSGTTYLHNALDVAIPDLHVTRPKEARIFIDRQLFSKPGHQNAINTKYSEFFPGDTRGKILLDATPEYLHQSIAVKRIFEYNPSMKWIICIRNPISRCFSQWQMRRRNGIEKREFLICLNEAVAALKEPVSGEPDKPADWHGLLSRGLYCEQIDRVEALFGAENIHYVFTANMRRNHEEVISKCREFICAGINIPPTSISHGHLDPDIWPCEESLELLKVFYHPEIDRLAKRFCLDFRHWLANPMSD